MLLCLKAGVRQTMLMSIYYYYLEEIETVLKQTASRRACSLILERSSVWSNLISM